jgi:8-oxo-dGTP pyrophosphatase MutT (NUDIX family)
MSSGTDEGAGKAAVADAASLILMREQTGAAPLILMVQRAATLAFAAGAYVFPGGRVDPEDRAMAAAVTTGGDAVDAAARIAAIRETEEETGIRVETPAAALVPFARWRPEIERAPRRFDTRFYLALTHDAHQPAADGTETTIAFWATAADVLARCAAGDGRAIFPTRRILERLAGFGGFAQAREEAERLPARIISPWIENRADGDYLCIPDDAGYPITSEPLAQAARY